MPFALLTALALSPALAPPDDRPRLAVLDLEAGAGVSPALAARLGDAFAVEMRTQTSFAAVAGDELHSILNPVGASAPMVCSDEACLADVARRASATLVAFGHVEAGEVPVLRARLYDAASGEIIGERSVTGSSALRPEGAARAAEDLLTLAERKVGLAPPLWLSSPWTSAGTLALSAGAVVGLASAATYAFTGWIFINTFLDAQVRSQARYVNAAAIAGMLGGVAVVGVGLGLGAVGFFVE